MSLKLELLLCGWTYLAFYFRFCNSAKVIANFPVETQNVPNSQAYTVMDSFEFSQIGPKRLHAANLHFTITRILWEHLLERLLVYIEWIVAFIFQENSIMLYLFWTEGNYQGNKNFMPNFSVPPANVLWISTMLWHLTLPISVTSWTFSVFIQNEPIAVIWDIEDRLFE